MYLKAKHCCNVIKGILEQGDSSLFYEPDIRRYAIKEIHEDTTGTMANVVKYCPWCGTKLLALLADVWEGILKKELGFKNPMEAYKKKLIPKEFLTDEWWKKTRFIGTLFYYFKSSLHHYALIHLARLVRRIASRRTYIATFFPIVSILLHDEMV